MLKFTSSLYFKSSIAALVVITLGFIGALAMVDPVCSHCTMAIAHRAMLGAKFLTGAWLLAGALYCWDSRHTIYNKIKTELPVSRSLTSGPKDI